MTMQQPFASLHSPKWHLLRMTTIMVVLMLIVGGMGCWGLLKLRQEFADGLQRSVDVQHALTTAYIGILTTQRDNRQVLIDTDPAMRAGDIETVVTDIATFRAAIMAYLALPHVADENQDIAALNESFSVWWGLQQFYLMNLRLHDATGIANATALMTGTFRAQGMLLVTEFTHLEAVEQGDIAAAKVATFAVSQTIMVALVGISILAILVALILGVSITHHLTKVHAHMTAINGGLEDAVENVQQRNEEISAQQASLRQANDALATAMAERLLIEDQLVVALSESERLGLHLQTIFASVHDALLMFDAQGQEIYRNHACDILLNLAVGVSVNAHPPDITTFSMDGQFIPNEHLPMHRVLSGEWPDPPMNYVVHFPTGERKLVQIEAVPIHAPDGTLNSVLGVMRDVTSAYREERHNDIMRSLAHQCASALTEEAIAQTATHILKVGLDVPNCSIVVRRLDKPEFAQVLSMDLDQGIDASQIVAYHEQVAAMPISKDAPYFVLRVIASGAAHFNEAPLPESGAMSFSQLAILPLHYNDETFGSLSLSFSPDMQRQWDAPDQELLSTVADEIAVALHRARLHAEVQALAYRDPLTGLHNHRALYGRLDEALSAATRRALPLSVIMLDVDHFRSFNETHGHDIGDLALKMVAESIQRAIRAYDVAARYGGEEFTVILPETGTADAVQVAERMRREIAAARIMVPGHSGGIPVTASLGVATFPAHASVPTSLLKAADIALYAAKHGGRNHVRCYSAQLLAKADDQDDTQELAIVLPPTADLEAVRALLMTIDLRDGFTAAHSEGVSRYAAAIATKLNLAADQVEAARLGGLIHDVGKIAMPATMLMKTGPLTEAEWQVMRQHPLLGEQCLVQIATLRHLLPMVRSHHERLDGSGYPDGLRGAGIDILVRIVTVADAFDAYVAERPYHPSRSLAIGIDHLRAEVAAGHFDALVVEAFIGLLTEQSAMREPLLTRHAASSANG